MSSKQSRPDARLQKDEALAQLKKAAQQNPVLGNVTAPMGMPRLDGSLSVETTSPALPSGSDRRNAVFPDPVAFRYLAEDPSVQVVESRGELRGYELYLVEQWACSRQSPALVIAAFTGDPKHTVVVGVLAVPADRNDWSPQLKFYFDAMQQYHARPKETDLGELMVTNLSNFPSALTVISVPDGDMKRHRQAFIVNENLKRMGCSGRSGMTLTNPTPATQAKFYAMYKIHEKVPLFEAVLDLVKLCQVALFIFGMLDYGYIDGLLCDATEIAIGNWWTEVGSEFYNIEPTDGILGPSTVAALLGTLMGARNRLSSYGAPVTKDVFDIDHTKRAIGHFQKSQKLEKTRRLDRQTLLKLHKVTAKAAAGEEWGVQKAINSTVSQFGKRGEILSGVIGTREKAGIGEIETVDIDKFKELVHGERCKWLWRGKPRRVPHEHHERSLPDMTNLFGKEEEKEREPQKDKDKDATGPNRKISFPPEDLEPSLKTRETTNSMYPSPTPSSTYAMPDSAADGALHKQMFKSVADRVSDARSGFGRIRDAVGGGLKSHGNRPRDEFSETSSATPGAGGLVQSPSGFSSPMTSGKVFTWQNKPQEYMNAFQKKHPDNIQAANEVSQTTSQATSATPLPETARKSLEIREQLDNARKEIVNSMSAAPSSINERDLLGPFLQAERNGDSFYPALQRRHSVATPSHPLTHTPNENRWPRRLSFSAAAEAVLYWDEIVDLDEEATTFEEQRASAEFTQALYGHILGVQSSLSPWVTAKVKDVEALEEAYKSQDESLQQAYYTFSDEHQRMKQNSTEIIAEEKGRVTMAIKDVEVQAAKLDYEINALLSKVQDVEDGIAGFEANVVEVEKQAEELKKQLETESLLHWLVRTLTGIGTGPNITRED